MLRELLGEREGPGGGAVWDIFAADDLPKIVAFLWRVAREDGIASKLAHPVHDATFYLDATLRRRLWREAGVVGWRFVQREGDAVFIPAGCPHQVFNLRSSIKVAEDFVSPEHARRCVEVTEQLRSLPQGHARANDTLGIGDILLHAVSHSLSALGAREAA